MPDVQQPLLEDEKNAEEGKAGEKDKAKDGCCKTYSRFECLSSGEPPEKQDPFKYSQSEFHEMGHSLKSKHGCFCLKVADEFVAAAVIGALVLAKSCVLGIDVVQLLGPKDFTSLAAVKLANDVIEWAIVVGVSLMWWTFCFWDDVLHSFWKFSFWPLPSLMPGGFMPRLAAFSLGILMFTTGTLVSEGRVEGKKLWDKFDDEHWQLCRATDMDVDGAEDMWFGRILRRPPAVRENGLKYQCFKSDIFGMGTRSEEFNVTLLSMYSNATLAAHSTGTEFGGVEHPYSVANHTPLLQSHGWPLDRIEAVIALFGLAKDEDFPLFSFHCMYQCVKWKSVGLMTFIQKIGTIVAGSGVVIKFSDLVSTNFGGHLWGCPLVSETTNPKQIQRIIKATRATPRKGRSKLFAAFACCMCMWPLRFASKLDNDGFYTVDYYVTAVFFSSLLMACMVRQFNPYKMMMIAYTKTMWLHGEDSFIDLSKHEFRKLNLYEWLHLSQHARGDHLLNYARMVTMKDIDKELSMRKDVASLEDIKEQAKKVGDPFFSCLAINEKWLPCFKKQNKFKTQAKKAEKFQHECNDVAPLKFYHNENAQLVVKVMKNITCDTHSPPIPDDGNHQDLVDAKIKPGVTVLKTVVVRRNAVGTVVDKVDGERIKVRFPRKVPEDPDYKEAVGKPGDANYRKHSGYKLPVLPKSVPKIAMIEKDGAQKKVPLTTTRNNKTVNVVAYEHKGQVRPDFTKYTEEKLEEKWNKAKKDFTTLHQYTVAFTPSPSLLPQEGGDAAKKKKKKLNSWLHNAVVDALYPESHHMKDTERHDRDNLRMDENKQDEWEDVIVPIHQVLEVSEDWLGIEEEREFWKEFEYKPGQKEEKEKEEQEKAVGKGP